MALQNDISKRHTDNHQNDMYRQSPTLLDIFTNQGERALFSYTLKVEKIVAALYLITDVMDADLPLTGAIRGESLDLLNACYRLLTQANVQTPAEISRVVVRIEHVMSLVSIGRIAHHISDMNAQIILAELTRVLELINGEIKIVAKRYATYNHHTGEAQPVISHKILDDVLFDRVAQERKVVHAAHHTRTNTQAGHSQPAHSLGSPQKLQSPVQSINDIKTTFSSPTSRNDVLNNEVKILGDKSQEKIKTTFKTTESKKAAISGIGTSRRDEILKVVRSHKDATINDIRSFVMDCSEKTIQREIAALISLGLITKQGDKRWATYQLAA